VIDAVHAYDSEYPASVHRGLHALAERARVIALERDVVALATPEQAVAWNKLDSIEASLARMPPAGRRDELAERARLLRGTLRWHLDAEYKVRQRKLDAGLRELDRELELARHRLARVDAAGPEAALDTAALANRAAALRERIAQVEPQINTVVAAQERALADLAVRELEARKRRLDSYAGQAQFALASLYDSAAAGGAQ
jgi:chromosome segregation ATPase